MTLIDDRVLIETSLEVAKAERRNDGGWVLWHDQNCASGENSAGLWANIDAALERLNAAGWLREHPSGSGLVTVCQKAKTLEVVQ